MLVPFNIIPLGTRFKYVGLNSTWVKIDINTIAAWDSTQITTNWHQQICSFAETDTKEALVQEVKVVE